jgi:hypothetical protein
MPERARTDLWEPQGSNPLGPPGPELARPVAGGHFRTAQASQFARGCAPTGERHRGDFFGRTEFIPFFETPRRSPPFNNCQDLGGWWRSRRRRPRRPSFLGVSLGSGRCGIFSAQAEGEFQCHFLQQKNSGSSDFRVGEKKCTNVHTKANGPAKIRLFLSPGPGKVWDLPSKRIWPSSDAPDRGNDKHVFIISIFEFSPSLVASVMSGVHWINLGGG